MAGPLLAALNALALLGIGAVLVAAYAFQVALNELPCPLCTLQRVAFCALAFGFLLNVRFGPRALHYGVILLGAAFGMAVSGRQVLLHITPGSGAYGSAFLGLHYYTWAFLLFAASMLATAGLLIAQPDGVAEPRRSVLTRAAIGLAIAVTLANAVTTFLQCGPIECIDDPVRYWIADRLR